MSGSGGVEFAASSFVNQATDLHGVDSVETTAQVPVRLNVMNGPDTEMLNLKQQRTEKDHNAVGRKSRENHMIKNPLFESELSILSTNESEGITKINNISCSCNKDLSKNAHLVTSNVNTNVMDVDTDSSKISKLKTKGPGAVLERGLTNGCCNCHGKKTVLNVDEQGSLVSNVHDDLSESQTLGNVNTTLQQMEDLENLTCNSHINEPLSDLTKMVENVCLDREASPDIQFSSSMEKFKPDTSQENLPCDEQAATCGDLLAGMDQSFGVIGPAGADLDDTELEELPASLSDFVLGCHDNQYAVPPCPPNDSDINTIHIQKDDHPIVLVPYKSEVQMPDIMMLITKDLSEPYSIYTYRYFIHNWPQLCFLAMHQDKCVGAIVCKLDVHKKMVRRGYIAMLAVDENYRKLQIGSSLVKKAIRAMVRGECDEVVLETEITNKPALRLYENLGFVRDKRLFRYYLNGVDALRLKLWLR